jgi:5,10-methenyltetrahydromethanopterin hydrogenase
MTHSFTTYYIEVKESDGTNKIVPHTDKKHYKFLDGKKATEFLKKIKDKNPNRHFRRVKETTMVKQEDWL